MGEAAKCICPMSDARECFRFRHELDLLEDLDDDVSERGNAECRCGCHADHAMELEDEDWGDGDG